MPLYRIWPDPPTSQDDIQIGDLFFEDEHDGESPFRRISKLPAKSNKLFLHRAATALEEAIIKKYLPVVINIVAAKVDQPSPTYQTTFEELSR